MHGLGQLIERKWLGQEDGIFDFIFLVAEFFFRIARNKNHFDIGAVFAGLGAPSWGRPRPGITTSVTKRSNGEICVLKELQRRFS